MMAAEQAIAQASRSYATGKVASFTTATITRTTPIYVYGQGWCWNDKGMHRKPWKNIPRQLSWALHIGELTGTLHELPEKLEPAL